MRVLSAGLVLKLLHLRIWKAYMERIILSRPKAAVLLWEGGP